VVQRGGGTTAALRPDPELDHHRLRRHPRLLLLCPLRCARCILTDRLHELLDDDTGAGRRETQAVGRHSSIMLVIVRFSDKIEDGCYRSSGRQFWRRKTCRKISVSDNLPVAVSRTL